MFIYTICLYYISYKKIIRIALLFSFTSLLRYDSGSSTNSKLQ